MPTVHQATWRLLRALGVRKVFGNPGSVHGRAWHGQTQASRCARGSSRRRRARLGRKRDDRRACAEHRSGPAPVRKAFRRHISRPTNFVPAAEGFGAAVRAGLGWGMFSRKARRPSAGQRFVRPGIRHAPRRAGVLAVLEIRQPDRRPYHRRGAVRSYRTGPAAQVLKITAPRSRRRGRHRGNMLPPRPVRAARIRDRAGLGTSHAPGATAW